jgi:hypothetical protein
MEEIRVRSSRDDKVEGGGTPWHKWRWMDRFEKAPLRYPGFSIEFSGVGGHRTLIRLTAYPLQQIHPMTFAAAEELGE